MWPLFVGVLIVGVVFVCGWVNSFVGGLILFVGWANVCGWANSVCGCGFCL